MSRYSEKIFQKLQLLKEELPYYIQRKWQEANKQIGYNSYAKFVILSRKRSGSNFLKSSLNSHPNIRAYNELFHSKDYASWGMKGYNIRLFNRKVDKLRQTDLNKFMNDYVYRKYNKNIKAVGFKLFYIHGRHNQSRTIWDYLTENKDIKILRLVRKNYLAVITSKHEAIKSKTWVVTKQKSFAKSVDPVYLNPQKCEHLFRCFNKEDQILRKRFKHHKYLYITYKEITSDNEALERVQDFLNVDIQSLTASTKKQAKRPLSKRIANYEELYEYFADTQWHRFFIT